mgnify:CR=1 FL=1
MDVVTSRATTGHLPHAAALGEAVRRRRATDGPAQKAFATLVGLELRPRRLREAASAKLEITADGKTIQVDGESVGVDGTESVAVYEGTRLTLDDFDVVFRAAQGSEGSTGPSEPKATGTPAAAISPQA